MDLSLSSAHAGVSSGHMGPEPGPTLGPAPKTFDHAGPGPEPHSQSSLWLHRPKALAPLPPRLTLAMRVQAGHGLHPPRPPLAVPTPAGMPVEAGTPASLLGHVCSRTASGKDAGERNASRGGADRVGREVCL